MFEKALNKVKWQQLLKNVNKEKLRRAISELFIPYNIDIKKFGINEECLKKHTCYDYETQQSCSPSLVYWIETVDSDDYPMGFPFWFYVAFPDVAKWTQTEDGRKVLRPFFEEAGSLLGDDDGRLRIFALKKTIDSFIEHTKRKLEISV